MKKRREEPGYKSAICWITGVFLVIYPFITYFHLERLSEKSQKYFANTDGYTVDFFLYHKEIALIIFSVFLVLFFLGEKFIPDHTVKDAPLFWKESRKVWILVGVYAVCIVASMVRAVLNGNGDTALLGTCTEYEGGLALLAYLVMFLAGYHYFAREKYHRILLGCLDVLMILIGALAVFEYCYKPVYELSWMKYLIAPSQWRSVAESLKNEYYSGQVALALYNPGYLGGLAALLFPISIGRILSAAKIPKKIFHGIISAGVFCALVVSTSTGALYATFAGMILFVFFFRKEMKTALKSFGIFALSAFLVMLVCGGISENGILSAFVENIRHESTLEQSYEADRFDLKKLELCDEGLVISSEEHSYYLNTEKGLFTTPLDLTLVTENGEEICLEWEGEEVVAQTTDGRIGCVINEGVLSVDLGFTDPVDFYLTEDGIRFIGQNGAILEEIPQPQIEGMEQFYSIATGRGYLWISTLPLLPKSLLIGYGPGGFVFEYNQNEAAGLLLTEGSCNFLVDKPHNWYLQVAVNTGGISLLLLILLLVFYSRHFWKNRSLDRHRDKQESVFHTALFIGIFAFAITGIVNDSCITVNPIFWLLFGAGFGNIMKETRNYEKRI